MITYINNKICKNRSYFCMPRLDAWLPSIVRYPVFRFNAIDKGKRYWGFYGDGIPAYRVKINDFIYK